MTYISERKLRELNFSADFLNIKRSFMVTDPNYAKLTAFLSHSHKDKTLVEGLLYLLAAELKLKIYIDWQDSSMPRVTSRETAEKIKKRINTFDLFLVLATKNALESRWVPWEIGIADSMKPNKKIILIPISDETGNFSGSEYLQLYQVAKYSADGKICIFQPNELRGVEIGNFTI